MIFTKVDLMTLFSGILSMVLGMFGLDEARIKNNHELHSIPYHYRVTPYQFGEHRLKVIGLARPDYQQDPEKVIRYLKVQGVSSIFGLDLSSSLISLAQRYELKYFNVSIPDFSAPDISVYDLIYETVLAEHLKGHQVAVHCRAGIGRTGVVLAALKLKELAQDSSFYESSQERQSLVKISFSPHPLPVTSNVFKAIELIRAVPGNEDVIEVADQIESLHIYENHLRSL
jgi:hypothetical protein